MKKVVVAVSALLLASACQNMAGMNKGSENEAINRYNAASRNLPAFAKIPGDPTGARASDRVFFSFDSAVLDSQAQSTLKRQADYLNKNSGVSAVVEGHCDERGTREYNLALGERRAAAAKKFLVSSGVSSSSLSTVSYGKERPAVVGSNETAWGQNRRAVTTLSSYK